MLFICPFRFRPPLMRLFHPDDLFTCYSDPLKCANIEENGREIAAKKQPVRVIVFPSSKRKSVRTNVKTQMYPKPRNPTFFDFCLFNIIIWAKRFVFCFQSLLCFFLFVVCVDGSTNGERRRSEFSFVRSFSFSFWWIDLFDLFSQHSSKKSKINRRSDFSFKGVCVCVCGGGGGGREPVPMYVPLPNLWRPDKRNRAFSSSKLRIFVFWYPALIQYYQDRHFDGTFLEVPDPWRVVDGSELKKTNKQQNITFFVR